MTFNYNTCISEQLTNYFKDYTTEIDVAKACEKSKIGFHTLRRLRLGEINVSNKANENALIELMRLAIKNAENNIHHAIECKNDLTEILDCV
ncbi:hypothetical protein D1632_15595 [Chryseobacterium nematophagum]|uniref:Uncharacterized protein n=1 Tax=Chryseobacterium nematophagum TaxID=2305228 RepID=A0A3M7L8A1_9FLAO|nr:hypothetical protein [Chryseobacterium nematophagum]RMZ58988.1 hypothetical protein D1632_15595 [Chryseobacterium nematophagum]